MEIELTNHQDVADPDQMASGVAGTGQENRNKKEISEKLLGNDTPHNNSKNSDEFFSSSGFSGTHQNGRRNREIIGLGVLFNGPMNAGRIPDTGHSAGKYVPEDPPEGHGDLIFSLYERQERIADRLNKKIERLDHRLTKIEERGRS